MITQEKQLYLNTKYTMAINFLKKEQIDTSYIKETNEAPTGFQIKNQVDAGDPEVIYFRKGSAA